MGLSLAAASKESNLKPKDDGDEVKVAEFGGDMVNKDDTVRESQVDANNTQNPSGGGDIALTFNPKTLNTKEEAPQEHMDMSFGGNMLIKKQVNSASTISKGNDETQDQSRDEHNEFANRDGAISEED
mmetsp:Transcript_19950/g.22280  ORF Transcript_19950/g.22280 Transcript_19950/m.22280 type:complete len:128 (+) Transcript_19950:256-639(+)